jgi:hypothetical protein
MPRKKKGEQQPQEQKTKDVKISQLRIWTHELHPQKGDFFFVIDLVAEDRRVRCRSMLGDREYFTPTEEVMSASEVLD